MFLAWAALDFAPGMNRGAWLWGAGQGGAGQGRGSCCCCCCSSRHRGMAMQLCHSRADCRLARRSATSLPPCSRSRAAAAGAGHCEAGSRVPHEVPHQLERVCRPDRRCRHVAGRCVRRRWCPGLDPLRRRRHCCLSCTARSCVLLATPSGLPTNIQCPCPLSLPPTHRRHRPQLLGPPGAAGGVGGGQRRRAAQGICVGPVHARLRPGRHGALRPGFERRGSAAAGQRGRQDTGLLLCVRVARSEPPAPRIATPPLFAPPRAQASAALASAALLFKPTNPWLAQTWLAKAEMLYAWGKAKPGALQQITTAASRMSKHSCGRCAAAVPRAACIAPASPHDGQLPRPPLTQPLTTHDPSCRAVQRIVPRVPHRHLRYLTLHRQDVPGRRLALPRHRWVWAGAEAGCFQCLQACSSVVSVLPRAAITLLLPRPAGKAAYNSEAFGWYTADGGRWNISPYVSWEDMSASAAVVMLR